MSEVSMGSRFVINGREVGALGWSAFQLDCPSREVQAYQRGSQRSESCRSLGGTHDLFAEKDRFRQKCSAPSASGNPAGFNPRAAIHNDKQRVSSFIP